MADYKEGIVESIKIATLEKQIEILEKLGLSKDEILEKMSDENADMLTLILNKIDGLYEQEEQALVEQLARTLLANQSEASVKYVLEHELIGKVLKYITKSQNKGLEDKNITEILSDRELSKIVIEDSSLLDVYVNSIGFSRRIVDNSVSREELVMSHDRVLKIYRKDGPLRRLMCEDKRLLLGLYKERAYVYYMDEKTSDKDYSTVVETVGKDRLIPLAHGRAGQEGIDYPKNFADSANIPREDRKLHYYNYNVIYPYKHYSSYHPEDPSQGIDENHFPKLVNYCKNYVECSFIIAIPTGETTSKAKRMSYDEFVSKFNVRQ